MTVRRPLTLLLIGTAAGVALALAAIPVTGRFAALKLLSHDTNVVVAAEGYIALARAPEEPFYLTWGYQPGNTRVEVIGELVPLDEPFQEPQPTIHMDCEVVVSESGGFRRFEVKCPLEATVVPPPTTTTIQPPSPTPTETPEEPPPTAWTVHPGDSGISEKIDELYPGAYGTVSLRAVYTGNDTPVLITNAHVATRAEELTGAPTYKCCEGDDFLSPTPKNAGGERRVLGETWYWYPHDVVDGGLYWMDAAAILFRDGNPDYADNIIKGTNLRISGFSDAMIGEYIEKVGARTGLTRGQVVGEDACLTMLAGKNRAIMFCGQYVVKGKKDDAGVMHPFSLPGDSGSVAFRRAGNGEATFICQVFAGTTDGQYTACTPAEMVMRMMHLRLP